MSYNWDNVIWQNKAGRWGIGFYKRISAGSSWDEDYDSEWDDDFDYSEFHFASMGHSSQQSAIDSWNGANPGSHTVVHWSKENASEIAEWEDMAKACNIPAYAKERQFRLEREAATALRKRIRENLRKDGNAPITGVKHSLRFSTSKPISNYGLVQDYNVTLRTDPEGSDWIGFIDTKHYKNGKKKDYFRKVWNTKTRTPAPDLLSAKRVTISPRYGW